MRKIQLEQSYIELRKPEIEQARVGDQNAMFILYQNYSVAMLNAAYRILNSKEDAEDVLQDCFIKAFSNLDQYNYESTFGAWLKRIVINQSIDFLKKKKAIVFEEYAFVGKDDLEVSDSVELDNKVDVIYEALHSLPDGYRTVLSLYMLEGYDHSEIAEILSIEISTSISQLSRAKKKLKSIITKS